MTMFKLMYTSTLAPLRMYRSARGLAHRVACRMYRGERRPAHRGSCRVVYRSATHPGRLAAVVMALVLGTAPLVAAGADGTVLATTPWTAAFAELAGAEEVEVLAPYDMRHPPEYELRATDLFRVDEAELLVYAGYENMMSRLESAIGDPENRSVQITTRHTRETFEEQAMAIARELGTEAAARENLDELLGFLDSWSKELAEYGLDDQPILTHFHQAALFEDLGANVAETFGPAPLEAQQIAALSREDPALIIDNWHNEVAQPLAEIMEDVPVVSFINFPGEDGTRTILDVLQYNRRKLNEALAVEQR